MKLSKIINYLQEKYPPTLASSFDVGKIGLQFGSPHSEIKKIMIALDGSSGVVEEAIQKKVDLLITHHPFLFNAMLSMDYETPFGKKMLNVFDHRLNIYAMHTNFDVAKDGMNDILAKMLELDGIHAEKDEIDGNCFLRMGNVAPISLLDFSKKVIQRLELDGVRVIGDKNKMIHKVGIIGGGGSGDIMHAIFHKCDCFITGEVKHNHALDAIDYDIAVIEINHDVESRFKSFLQKELSHVFSSEDVEIIVSETETSPFWRI